MAKRTPSNTAANAVKAMLDAASPLPMPPTHVRMRPEDMPFWEGIARARTRDEWSDADLVVGAQLARCQYDIERESEKLELEGTVVRNDKGTQIMNPRVSVLEQLARRELALLRTLRMGGAVTGSKQDLDKARKVQRLAEEVRAGLKDDELLAQ